MSPFLNNGKMCASLQSEGTSPESSETSKILETISETSSAATLSM